LVSSAVLDSLATLRLVSFLEERFQIEMQPHEVDAEHLDTLSAMATLVRRKKGGERAPG
jgi:acyl carrier protein